MEKTPTEVEHLKQEIRAWLKKRDLAEDIGWIDLRAKYGDEMESFPYAHYLGLWTEGPFYDVLWAAPTPDLNRLLGEFEDILARNGCWYEHHDNCTISIMDRVERNAGDHER